MNLIKYCQYHNIPVPFSEMEARQVIEQMKKDNCGPPHQKEFVNLAKIELEAKLSRTINLNVQERFKL